MERLTDKHETNTQRKDYGDRTKNDCPRNILEKRFLHLAAYEDAKMPPEFTEGIAKFTMWVSENGIGRLRHLVEASEGNRIVILPSKESRKKVQGVSDIVVKYGFRSDCAQKYDGTLYYQCDCFQDGVDVIRQALLESEDLQMPEYTSRDMALQRLLCKESEFNHWGDYNPAQYIIVQIVPGDVTPATHIQKLGSIVQIIKNERACRTLPYCGTGCTEMTSWMRSKYCPWCDAKLNGGVCDA